MTRSNAQWELEQTHSREGGNANATPNQTRSRVSDNVERKRAICVVLSMNALVFSACALESWLLPVSVSILLVYPLCAYNIRKPQDRDSHISQLFSCYLNLNNSL